MSTHVQSSHPADDKMKNFSKKVLFGLAVFVLASFVLGGRASAAPTVQTNPANNISSGQVTLNGLLNPQGVETTFWFEYGISQSLGQVTTQQTVNAYNSQISVYNTIYGLQGNATYYFRLVARDSFGNMAYGQTLNFVATPQLADAMPYVQTLDANVFQNSATLNGQVNLNGLQGSYWFEYGTTPNTGQTIGLAYDSGSGQRTYSTPLGNLIPNQTYYFRAVVRNSYGTSYGVVRSFTVNGGGAINPPPQSGSVATLPATGVGQGGAELRGRVNPANSSITVWFEYGRTAALNGETPRTSAGSGASDIDYMVTLRGLTPGTTYYYRAVGQNQFGLVRGQIASFRTAGTAPSGGGSTPPVVTPPVVTPATSTPSTPATSTPPAAAAGCFKVSPTISSAALAAGQEFTYSLTYKNGCGQTFTNGTLHLTLPLPVEFASTNYPFLTRDGNVITYSLGAIAPNFQGAVTVTGKVKDQVNTGDTLAFQVNLDYTDGRGQSQRASSDLTALVAAGASVDNGTSTLGASVGDALGGLFHSGWFWLILFLILIALFIFWLASRRRADDDEDDDDDDGHSAPAH